MALHQWRLLLLPSPSPHSDTQAAAFSQRIPRIGLPLGRIVAELPGENSRSLQNRRKTQQANAAGDSTVSDNWLIKAQASPPSAPYKSDVGGVSTDWHAPDLWKDALANLTSPPSAPEFVSECIGTIRGMLRNLGDGAISLSPYDTAWVGMVPALDGSPRPQFPKCMDWIKEHQWSDGSWGETDIFSAYDRVLNTLACVVALQKWGIGEGNVERGCEFIRQNIHKIADENEQHMLIGFEIAFPGMMEDARKLGLVLPYESEITQKILKARERQLEKIPMDILHSFPSTLLHSVEGLRDVVDWERLVKLQSKDGSLLASPASTACALMYTGDHKCFQYLNSLVGQFDGGVRNVYPVDLFERMWIVDRLERLGIAYHFKKEIKMCLDYVYKEWTATGLAWGRGSSLTDLDDTAMGFRLLRKHGYEVSADVFLPFKKGDQFSCFAGQSGQAMTGIFNFYRASQTLFPGETLLEESRVFCRTFLEAKWHANQVYDKWSITKDLPGEVEYALTFPFYASLPRVETRAYLDHYGTDDIWIGKTLYKMHYLHNPTLPAFAKADFNLCQERYQQELEQLVRWNESEGFAKLSYARQKVVECFFSAAATMHEPELSSARRVWAQMSVLVTVVDDYFDTGVVPMEDLLRFKAAVDSWDPSLIDNENERQRISFMGLYNTLNAIAAEGYLAQGRGISRHLIGYCKRWVGSILVEAQWAEKEKIPQWEEYMVSAEPSIALECVMLPPIFFLGEELSDDVLEGEEFVRITKKVNVIGRLLNDLNSYEREAGQGKANGVLIQMRDNPGASVIEALATLRKIIDTNMQELTEEVLQASEVPQACKQVLYHMARVVHLFYKDTDGYSSLTAMKEHVKKLLFEPVL